MQTIQDTIQVKGLPEAGIGDFSLGRRISNYGIQPQDPRVYRNAPTLAELRHAFFGRTLVLSDKSKFRDDGTVEIPAYTGDWLCPEYRTAVHDEKGRGERTCVFLQDGKEIIVRPESISYENGVWRAEGHFDKVELPPEGFVLEYDKPTGMPSRTGSEKDAKKIFGKDRSYFWYNPNGLRAVRRGFCYDDYGPFDVSAYYDPGYRAGGVGVRFVSRLSNGEAVATPVNFEIAESDYRKAVDFFNAVREGRLEPEDIRRESEDLYRMFLGFTPKR